MTIIKARLDDQVLTMLETPVVASGGVEEDTVFFEFDDTWTGYTKKAVFYCDKSNVYHVTVGADNTAVVPWEVLQRKGFMFFGVFGTKGSEIKTSTVARYRVENGAITIGSESQPTQNIYADIIANTAARHTHINKTVLDGITSEKVMEWNGKSNFSGSYNDLKEKPKIPTVPTDEISANTAARHSHDNKTVLDGITAEKVTEWDGKNSITDSGGYFNSDTVEGALQEIGAELAGINTLLGSGEITS